MSSNPIAPGGPWLMYLDPRNRAIVTAGPPNGIIGDVEGLIEFPTDSETWRLTYQVALGMAQQGGLDLAVGPDGSYSVTSHIPNQDELDWQPVQSFLNHPGPALEDVVTALKVLAAAMVPPPRGG